MINATTGAGIARDVEAELLSDVEQVQYRRQKAMGIAVGAHLRHTDRHAGYLSTGEHTWTRIAGPHEMLHHIFFGV
jgi:hypothetical protein